MAQVRGARIDWRTSAEHAIGARREAHHGASRAMTTHSSSFDELHATDGIRRRPVANVKANDPTNATPGGTDKDEKRDEAPRTTELVLGRTPDGQLFRVVETRDMVKSVFHPQHPKTLLDLVLLGLLLFQVFLYCILTREQAQIFFLVYFAIWRITYNGGLGYILTKQSQTRWIVRFVAVSYTHLTLPTKA